MDSTHTKQAHIHRHMYGVYVCPPSHSIASDSYLVQEFIDVRCCQIDFQS